MGAQAASLAGLGRFVHAQQGHAPSAPGSKKLALSLSGYRVDRVDALMDGRVSVDGCHTTFEVATIGQLNTDVFSGRGNRQVTEIGLTPFILAYANDDFRGHSLLPIFPLRLFSPQKTFSSAPTAASSDRKTSGVRGWQRLATLRHLSRGSGAS